MERPKPTQSWSDYGCIRQRKHEKSSRRRQTEEWQWGRYSVATNFPVSISLAVEWRPKTGNTNIKNLLPRMQFSTSDHYFPCRFTIYQQPTKTTALIITSRVLVVPAELTIGKVRKWREAADIERTRFFVSSISYLRTGDKYVWYYVSL